MTENRLDKILDETLDAIRDEHPNVDAERAAADAAWARIAAELPSEAEQQQDDTILGHEDFQALIPSYLAGDLAGAKVLLLEDHVSECVPCRRALKEARSGVQRRAVATKKKRSAASVWGWRAAAAAMLIFALIGIDVQTNLFTIRAEGLITIERVEGQVMQVTDDGGVVPVKSGDQLSFDQVQALRTGKNSGATFRMDDDSVVEMNERAQLAVLTKKKFWQRGRGNGVIELDRGSIIVEASPQGSGNLFVETPDTDVAVTGTVFAVNSGVKGSRVSVIEGSVDVAFEGDRNDERQLTPGQQATSHSRLGRVAIEDEISWSSKKLEHLALMAEVTRTLRDIELALDWPALRYDTTLLDLAPEQTSFYVAIPNISQQIADGYGMLQGKIAENAVLAQWWNDSVEGSEQQDQLAEMIGRIESYGAQLGAEVVVTMSFDGNDLGEPLIYAELRDEKGYTEMLRNDLETQGVTNVAFHGDLTMPLNAESYVSTSGGYVAIAPSSFELDRFNARAEQRGSTFGDSSFHASLAELYREGAEWIVAADVARMMPESSEADALGLSSLEHVIAERKYKDGMSESRFVATFDEPRQGLASWLDEPGPMGSLDFVSGNASFAASFAMRQPTALMEELLALAGADRAEIDEGMARFEEETGLNLQDDILDAMGGEFTIAFDGPIVPVPSWKMVLEVYDSARLQQTLEQLVDLINEHALNEGSKGLEIKEQGRFYTLTSLDVGLSAHYSYVDGYLIAGPSRALIQQSLSNRRNGLTLVNSAKFQQALPADAEVNFSAVVFQDLGSVLGPFARTLGAMSQRFSQQEQQILTEFGSTMTPSVTLAYGEPERLVFVNSSEGGLLSSTLGSFLRLDTLMSMQQLLTHAANERGAGQ